MMFSINSSLSALMAYGKKMGVHANNIANMCSQDFNRSRVIIKEGPDNNVSAEIERVDAPEYPVTDIDQGQVAENEDQPSETTLEDMPPLNQSNNVDLATEIVGVTVAQNAYEANTKVIKAQEEMLGTILDLLS
jgi:flagellar basal-body rod protein FlgC